MIQTLSQSIATVGRVKHIFMWPEGFKLIAYTSWSIPMDYNIPMPDAKVCECDEALKYDIHQAAVLGKMFNTQQRQVANAVLNSVMSPNDLNSTLFYPGWTSEGPSHTYISYTIARLCMVTAAWAGIAATL